MKAKVTINITYDPANVSSGRSVHAALAYAVRHLANNGLLSDENSVVDEWDYAVEIIKAPQFDADKFRKDVIKEGYGSVTAAGLRLAEKMISKGHSYEDSVFEVVFGRGYTTD